MNTVFVSHWCIICAHLIVCMRRADVSLELNSCCCCPRRKSSAITNLLPLSRTCGISRFSVKFCSCLMAAKATFGYNVTLFGTGKREANFLKPEVYWRKGILSPGSHVAIFKADSWLMRPSACPVTKTQYKVSLCNLKVFGVQWLCWGLGG